MSLMDCLKYNFVSVQDNEARWVPVDLEKPSASLSGVSKGQQRLKALWFKRVHANREGLQGHNTAFRQPAPHPGER